MINVEDEMDNIEIKREEPENVKSHLNMGIAFIKCMNTTQEMQNKMILIYEYVPMQK